MSLLPKLTVPYFIAHTANFPTIITLSAEFEICYSKAHNMAAVIRRHPRKLIAAGTLATGKQTQLLSLASSHDYLLTDLRRSRHLL